MEISAVLPIAGLHFTLTLALPSRERGLKKKALYSRQRSFNEEMQKNGDTQRISRRKF
jgi:hypothetical protein